MAGADTEQRRVDHVTSRECDALVRLSGQEPFVPGAEYALVDRESTSQLDRLRSALSIAKTPEGPRVVIWRHIEAPPERVWDLLVDTRRWPEWGPSVLDVETESPRIEAGSTGRVRTVFGRWLPFTVTRASKWAWAWRIGPVQATGHRVIPANESCRVGFEVPLYALPYLIVCWWGLRRIESLATADRIANSH